MEYQAKELFAKHGVPVTLGIVVERPEDARTAAKADGPRRRYSPCADSI